MRSLHIKDFIIPAHKKYICKENSLHQEQFQKIIYNTEVENTIYYISHFEIKYKIALFVDGVTKIDELQRLSSLLAEKTSFYFCNYYCFHNSSMPSLVCTPHMNFVNTLDVFNDSFFVVKINIHNQITDDFFLYIKKYFCNKKVSHIKEVFLEKYDAQYIKSLALSLKKIPVNDVLFSIVTLVYKKDVYMNELNSFKQQNCVLPVEFIPIINYGNVYKNCSEPLNYGIDLANGKYIILCHQDLLFPNKEWLNTIYDIIYQLEEHQQNWGVLGMAGLYDKDKPVLFISGIKNNKIIPIYEMFKQRYGLFKEVQTIDELCLIIKNNKHINNQLYIDEQCIDHFHFYGVDICLESLKRGFKNFAICADCLHLSDGTDNFVNNSHYEPYKRSAIRIYKKWSSLFPEIFTTTAVFNSKNKSIEFTILQIINKQHKKKVFDDVIYVND